MHVKLSISEVIELKAVCDKEKTYTHVNENVRHRM